MEHSLDRPTASTDSLGDFAGVEPFQPHPNN
jgi:hypothetical protein